ncbi:MAG: hypothetical protein CVV25_13315 [Ignavibacteriae bacterium HGW-Ignavibacteriae-4]|nr:MAG: hypothetical protein CVV25_13315 [Ignavibacteriae bacterium HGW-Ignavibacteriae-4]
MYMLSYELMAEDKPLLFGRYTKFSVGSGGKYLDNNDNKMVSVGPVYNIYLEHYLDKKQNWSLGLNYYYLNYEDSQSWMDASVNELPLWTVKYYFLDISNDLQLYAHFGDMILLVDLGGGLSYNLYDEKLYLECSFHYWTKFPLFLPAFRTPNIYLLNIGYKF